MKTRSLKFLRICVLVLGWLLVTGVIMGIWSRIVGYNLALNNPTSFIFVMPGRFNIGSALSSFFSGMGNAFLAFLIAAVVRMIEKQVPIGIEYANRLMIVCCLSYLADALIELYGLTRYFLATLSLIHGFDFRFLSTYAAFSIPAIAPLLYAASIYVLYRHFTSMVQFESEVA